MKNRKILSIKSVFFTLSMLVLAVFFASFTNAEDVLYERQVRAIDNAGNLSAFTAPWNFYVDGTKPSIYFTGATPADGAVSTNTTFTGEIEASDLQIQEMIWNWEGTGYTFNVGDNTFNTGDYSLTDYSDTGLVLALNFDYSGDLNDYSPYNNGATNSGAIWTGNGAYGGAYKFNNINDYIYAAAYTGDEYTIVLDTYIPSNDDAFILSNQVSVSDQLNIFMNAGGIQVQYYSGSFIKKGYSAFTPGWYQIATYLNKSTGTLKLRVNGEEITYTGGTVVSVNLTTANGQLLLGKRDRTNQERYYNGIIDNVRVYDQELTPDQIYQQYNTTVHKYSDTLRGIDTTQADLAEGTYTYQAFATDSVGQTGETSLRTYTVDTTPPVIYFTGDTPASGTVSSIADFTGVAEIVETNLSGVIRSRSGTEHKYNLTGEIFTEGFFSESGVIANSGVVSNVTFNNGKAIFGGSSDITYDTLTTGPERTAKYDFRINQLQPSNYFMFNRKNEPLQFYIRYANGFMQVDREGSPKVNFSGFVFEEGVDYSMTITSDGSELKLYINGLLYDTKAAVTTKDFKRGRLSNYLSTVNISIDLAEVYNYAQTSGQIADTYLKKLEYSTGNIRQFTSLEPNLAEGTYAYAITGVDYAGQTAFTGVQTYEVAIPPVVEHVSPLSGAILSGTTASLVWSGNDGTGVGISGYYYNIYRLETGAWLEIISGSTANTGINLVNLKDATYRWDIQAEDLNNNLSEWSTGWTFEANKFTDLNISKTADQTSYTPGDYITYTIDFINSGTITATGVEIIDTITQDNLEYISSSYTGPAGYTFSTGLNISGDLTISWTGFDLTSDQTGQIILTAQVINTFGPTMSGRGYSFDGVNDGIVVGSPADLGWFHTGEFAMSLWFKTADTSIVNNSLVSERRHSPNESNFQWIASDSATQFSLRTVLQTSAGTVSTTLDNTGVWNHALVTRTGDTLELYINGTLKDSDPIDTGTSVATGDFAMVIGRTYSALASNSMYTGEIADIRVYDYALSASEAAGIANHTYIGTPLLRYKTDETTGTIAYDSAGNGHSGNIVNIDEPTFHIVDQNLHSYHYQLGRTDGNGSNGADTGVYIPRDESNTAYDVLGNPLQYSLSNPTFCQLGICNQVAINNTTVYNRVDYTPTTDLRITKSVTGDFYSGGVIEYTLTYGNSGYDAAESATITDTLIADLSGTNFSDVRDLSGDTYTYQIGQLATGTNQSVILTAVILTGAEGLYQISNTAYITGAFYDLNTDNNSGNTSLTTDDIIDPLIYFTGYNPVDNFTTTGDAFAGEAEILDYNPQLITRNWDGTDYIYNISSRYFAESFESTAAMTANGGVNQGGSATRYDGYADMNNSYIHYASGVLTQNYTLRFVISFDDLSQEGLISTPITPSYTNRLYLRLTDANQVNITSAAYSANYALPYTLQTGIIYDLVFAKNKLYINGERALDYNNGFVGNVDGYNLFAHTNGTLELDGNAYLFESYDTVLTSGQIADLYQQEVVKYSDNTRAIQHNKTDLAEGTYTYQASIEDIGGNTGTTEVRTYNVADAPIIYFTGATPESGFISSGTYFSGTAEAIEANLRTLSRNRDGTEYIFNHSGRESTFTTGDYSLTDYTDTGLVFAMNFDHDGDLTDYSSYGYDGTASGAVWIGNGRYQGAYEFDGADDYIDITHANLRNLLSINGTFTVSIMFNPQNYGTYDLLSSTISAFNRLGIGTRADGTMGVFTYEPVGSRSYTTTATYQPNQWNQLVAVNSGGEYTFYVNGVLTSTTTGTIAAEPSGILNIFLGRRNYEGVLQRMFDGTMDDIRIRDYKLTSGDVSNLYNTTITKYSTGLRDIQTTQTGLADGTYSYSACAEDIYNLTGCTETRDITIDTIDPVLVFTGVTPVDDYTYSGITVINAGSPGTTDWIDSNEDGIADEWSIYIAGAGNFTSIVTGNGFNGYAQRAEIGVGGSLTNIGIASNQILFEPGKTYKISFMRRNNAPFFVRYNSRGYTITNISDTQLTAKYEEFIFTANEGATIGNFTPYMRRDTAGDFFEIDDIRVEEIPIFQTYSYYDPLDSFTWLRDGVPTTYTGGDLATNYPAFFVENASGDLTYSVAHPDLAEGSYTYQSIGTDLAGNTGSTEIRTYNVFENPIVYFTGDTPVDGIITTGTSFTGYIEILEENLSGLIRNRNGTETIYPFNDYLFSEGMNSSGATAANGWINEFVDFTGGYATFTDAQSSVLSHTGYNLSSTGAFTIKTRIRIPSNPASSAGVVEYGDIGGRMGFLINPNGSILVTFSNGSVTRYQATSSSAMPIGQWTEVSVVHEDSADFAKLYLNGVEISLGATSTAGLTPETTGEIRIGQTNTSSELHFDGDIDYVQVYTRAMTNGEIANPIVFTNVTGDIRSYDIEKINLADDTYTYQACAEDIYNLTGCTEVRSFTLQNDVDLILTTKLANPYTTTGDFWMFTASGASWNNIYHSVFNSGDVQIGLNSNGTGLVTITNVPTAGTEYLAAFKLSGALAVGLTGIWESGMTGLDFSDATDTTLRPKLTYQGDNYLILGDIETNGTGAYDLIYGPDLALLNTQLLRSSPETIYDFDHNNIVSALEQAMIIYNLDLGGYLQDYLPSGLTIDDFISF